jgi:DNA-directed RNA polymerase specialized sigma24 family protein
MTVEEVAEVLSVSTATVKREWRIATAELYRALQPDGDLPQADAGQ